MKSPDVRKWPIASLHCASMSINFLTREFIMRKTLDRSTTAGFFARRPLETVGESRHDASARRSRAGWS